MALGFGVRCLLQRLPVTAKKKTGAKKHKAFTGVSVLQPFLFVSPSPSLFLLACVGYLTNQPTFSAQSGCL